MLAQRAQSLQSIAGADGRYAVELQILLHHVARVGVIFDDEHGRHCDHSDGLSKPHTATRDAHRTCTGRDRSDVRTSKEVHTHYVTRPARLKVSGIAR
jgi:hypothetical protein